MIHFLKKVTLFLLFAVVVIIDIANFRVFAFKIRPSRSGSRGGLGPHHGSALDHEGDSLDRLLGSVYVRPSTFILYPPLLFANKFRKSFCDL